MTSKFAIVLAAASLAAMAAPTLATEQTAAFGALTLNYDDAVWSVEGETIRCVADTCLAATVDVNITEGRTFCTRDTGYADAAQAFPEADRHAVNVHAINGLSLVFARSRVSADPESWAVYACVTREDVRYEFTSRIDELPSRFQDSAIFELLRGLVPPPPRMATLPLDGLVLDLPDDRWLVDREEGNEATLTCLPPHCDGLVPVFLAVTPVDADDPDPCGDRALRADAYTETTLVEPMEGPPFTVTTQYSMCRARTPPVLEACAVYEGQRYFLGTGVLAGCNFGPAVAPDLFFELVGAFRLPE